VDGALGHEGGAVSELRRRYDRDGFVVVQQLLDQDTVQLWQRHLDTLDAATNGLVPAQHIPRHPATSSLASELLGTRAELFGATFVVKPPASPWRVSWHQDGEPWQRQWGIEHAVTVWVSLDPTGPHNGGLRMIPGSHRRAAHALEPVDSEFDVFGWASPAHLVDETTAVDVTLEVGDVSAHHPAVMHASGPNASDGPRRALSLRYRGT